MPRNKSVTFKGTGSKYRNSLDAGRDFDKYKKKKVNRSEKKSRHTMKKSVE